MACPLCGDHCRCSYVAPRRDADEDVLDLDGRTSVLIDPERYDPTEEQFSASVYDDEEAAVGPLAPAETGPRASAAPPSTQAQTGLVADPAPPRETTLTGIERLAHEVY